MTKRIIVNLSILFLFFIFLFGIISNLTIYINVWLISLPFLILFFDKQTVYLWVFCAGLILDILSPMPFGFYIMILFFLYIILSYLSHHILTQKSLSAFLTLNLVSLALFYISFFLINLFLNLMNYPVLYFISLKIIFIQTVINLILAVILFFITNFFTKRLRLETINRLQ